MILTAAVSLLRIFGMVFLTEIHRVFCEVRNEYLYKGTVARWDSIGL